MSQCRPTRPADPRRRGAAGTAARPAGRGPPTVGPSRVASTAVRGPGGADARGGRRRPAAAQSPHLRRAERPRQPPRPPPPRPGRRPRGPGRPLPRPLARHGRRPAGASSRPAAPTSRSTRPIPPSGSPSCSTTPGRRSCSTERAAPRRLPGHAAVDRLPRSRRDAIADETRRTTSPGGAALRATWPTSSTPRARPAGPRACMVTHAERWPTYLAGARGRYGAADGRRGAPVHSSISFDSDRHELCSPPLVVGGRLVDLLDEAAWAPSSCADALRGRRGYSLVKITPAYLPAARR